MNEFHENPVVVTGHVHPVTGFFIQDIANRRGWSQEFTIQTAIRDGVYALAAELAEEARNQPAILAQVRAALSAGNTEILVDYYDEEPSIEDVMGVGW